jgi:Skp family chaperone for outer membrane proteins
VPGIEGAPPPAKPAQNDRPPFSRKSLKVDIGKTAAPPTDESPMRSALGRAAAPEPEPVTLPQNPVPVEPHADSALIGDILGDLDSTFDALLSEPGRVRQSTRPSAINEAQTLFKQIAVAYIAPVRAFMLELRLGDASKDWIQVCAPAVSSMSDSALRMGLEELSRALSELNRVLEQADAAPGNTVSGKAREEVLAHAEALMAELPEAFAVDEERERREPIIVRSLLCQVPGVRKVQLDKIYRAGLTSLAMFSMASARELSETTGLDFDLCERIVARFARYRQEALAAPVDTEHAQALERLGVLASELKRLNREYDDDKRRVRQQRAEVVNELNVHLARMGAVDLVEKLERLPFQKKAEELMRFVNEKRKRAG